MGVFVGKPHRSNRHRKGIGLLRTLGSARISPKSGEVVLMLKASKEKLVRIVESKPEGEGRKEK